MELDEGRPDHERARRALRILHIDDDLTSLHLAEGILGRQEGVTLLWAMQGRVGLELAQYDGIDLILLARRLPDISGDEVLERLRDDPRTRAIPVVMVSAGVTEGEAEGLLRAGARAHLTKPLDAHSLLTIVDQFAR